MSNAFKNATKLCAWVDPVALGADPTGTNPADAAMAQAVATRLPIRLPAGTLLLLQPLNVTLAIGQDFIMNGEGDEVSRLVFGPDAARGISITYSTNAGGQAQGDKTAVRISGMDIETQRADGGSAIRVINTPPAGQVNETQVVPNFRDLRINGASDSAYWTTHIELENVTYPNITNVTSQDKSGRGVGISLNSTGDYSAVEFSIHNYRANELGTALKVRGRCEGVYASHFVAVSSAAGSIGIDWVSTAVNGGKKPLLLLSASHINVGSAAVKAMDVSQVIGADSLVYVTNSAAVENVGFDFQASGSLSNENHQLRGVTIIGLGDRAGSMAKGVKLGAGVSGCSIDARIDNLGTGVQNSGNNNFIAPGSKFSFCNVTATGFSSFGWYGELGTTASVDASLKREFSDGTNYARDQGREQLRVETFIYTATASTETITRNYARPFLNDTIVVMGALGEVASSTLSINTAASTAESASFRISGATPGNTYRINYIAYGY